MLTVDESLHDRITGIFLRSDEDLIANPYPLWTELRELAPVIESGPLFIVTRYAEAKEVYRDALTYSSDSRRRGTRAEMFRAALTPERRAAWDEIADFHAIWMQTTDDPTHSRLRNISIRGFTPGRIRELGEAMAVYVNEAIDNMAESGDEVDLMELALEVPLMIMTDLLDVPHSDRETIKKFSRHWFEYQFVMDDRIFISLEAQRGLQGYVYDMIEAHRKSPSPTGLVAALMGAEHEDRLSAEELAAMFFLLLFAGHETTTNMLATGTMNLLSNGRAEWNRLLDDQSLIPNAVEEMLRYVTPAQFHNRFVLEDINVAGTTIPAGATVTMLLAAANRDPRVFRDPETFDVGREDVHDHIAFGFGPHYCLGAALTRLEGAIALEALTRRVPEMELATDTFHWRGAAQLRGLAELPVRLGNVRAA